MTTAKGISNAPWTPEEVQNLNGYQECGRFHPYMCKCEPAMPLVATADGWECRNHPQPGEDQSWEVPHCSPSPSQDWAHDFTANDEWRKMLASPEASGFRVLRMTSQDTLVAIVPEKTSKIQRQSVSRYLNEVAKQNGWENIPLVITASIRLEIIRNIPSPDPEKPE